ncbi:hypothetical protein B7486_72120, partial [cyanobacterium TDX16]
MSAAQDEGRRPLWRSLAAGAGWIAIVLAADLSIGALVGVWVDPPRQEEVVASDWEPQVSAEQRVQIQVRSDTPAMRGAAWAEDYWEEYFEVEY